MTKATLSNIGQLLRAERGNRGIREVARDIGISPATLSRIETGKLPDLKTFSKICGWLKIDPAEFLGCKTEAKPVGLSETSMAVHLRAEKNLKPEAAKALTDMILIAREMILENYRR